MKIDEIEHHTLTLRYERRGLFLYFMIAPATVMILVFATNGVPTSIQGWSAALLFLVATIGGIWYLTLRWVTVHFDLVDGTVVHSSGVIPFYSRIARS